MPVKEPSMNAELKGRKVDPEKMRRNGWHDQGGANYHYGFARKKGLWLMSFNPVHCCECHPVKLYILLAVDAKSRITGIETTVHQIFCDGGFDDLGMGLFGPDARKARELIDAVLADEKDGGGGPETEGKKAPKAAKADKTENALPPALPPVAVEKIAGLLGRAENSKPIMKLIKDQKIRRVEYPMGIGAAFISSDDRLELKIGYDGIETVFLKKIGKDYPADLLCEGKPLHAVRRSDLIEIYGKPSHSDKDGYWDRFDNDKFLLHFQYLKETGEISMVMIMSPWSMI